jgi:hypothetical protein
MLQGDYYTRVDERLLAVLEDLKRDYGTWRRVADAVRMSTRTLRLLRRGHNYCVSLTQMDRILSRTDREWVLENFDWYTPEQLVELGYWKPMTTVGLKQYRQPEQKDS